MQEKIIIKKYANRRLYNTETSTYVTLADLFQMIKNNIDFTVTDAKTGEDITKLILTQIIFEQETEGHSMLGENFLRNLIKYYDDSLRNIMPFYLETTMQNFANNQERFRSYAAEYINKANESLTPLKMFEEITKQNLSIFEQAFKMFMPNNNK